MTVRDIMFALSTTGKVVITDNHDLYKKFESFADALIWVFQNKEIGNMEVRMIVPVIFKGDDFATIVIDTKEEFNGHA